MKKIQPVQIWVSGSNQIGSLLNCYIVYDNLKDSCNFYWAIWQADESFVPIVELTEGNLTMNNPDYDLWGQSSDINQAAYQWCADQLSLILIPQ